MLALLRNGAAYGLLIAMALRGELGAAEAAALAQGLRRTAEELMAPYAEAEDFCFKGVRG